MEKNDDSTIRLSKESLQAQAACPSRYEIKELIGQGGMGLVFRAVDLHLNRDVAIKILLFDGACDSDLQARFLREAKAMALLAHPNIVAVFASGLNEKGNPFHVMEYLKGESLAQELSRGPLTAAAFFEMMLQILSALEHAHALGIVHRDLKPSNIMHCKADDGKDLYKIIDFGIARVEMTADQAIKTLTRTEAILGSPNYISPEQCRGKKGDALSDIYSLGCLMYECVTGAPPFQGETAFETMYKQMNEIVPSLGQTARTSKSKELSRVIASCLEKESAHRPQSVSALKEELSRIAGSAADGLDLFAAPKKSSAGKFYISGIVVISFLVGTTALFYFVQERDSKVFREEQKGIVASSDKQAQLNKQLTELRVRISRFGATPEGIKDESARKTYLNKLFELGRTELKSSSSADAADAAKTFNSAIYVMEKYGGEYRDRIPAAYVYIAKAKQNQGNYEAALADFQKALDLVLQGGKSYKGKLTDIYLQRANSFMELRRFQQCRDDFLEVQNHCSVSVENLWQELDPAGEVRTVLIAGLADKLVKMNPQSSEEALQMALLAEMLSGTLEKIPTRQLESRATLQHAWHLLGFVPGQNEIKERIKAKIPANEATVFKHAGPQLLLQELSRLQSIGEFDKAMFVADQAIAQAELNRKDFDTLLRAYLKRGELLRMKSHIDQAISDLSQAEKLSHKCHPSHELRGMCRVELALAMMEGNRPGAEKQMEDVIQDGQDNKFLMSRYYLGLARYSLADAYFRKSRKALAVPVLESQWQLYETALSDGQETFNSDLETMLKILKLEHENAPDSVRQHADVFMRALAKTAMSDKQRAGLERAAAVVFNELGLPAYIAKMKSLPHLQPAPAVQAEKEVPGGEFSGLLPDNL